MSNTYLPADVRTRIVDLMKANKVTQKKLALTIGVHESTLGRFLNGTTEKLSEESVIRIANRSCQESIHRQSKSRCCKPSVGEPPICNSYIHDRSVS